MTNDKLSGTFYELRNYIPLSSSLGNKTKLKGIFGMACKFGLLDAMRPVAAAVWSLYKKNIPKKPFSRVDASKLDYKNHYDPLKLNEEKPWGLQLSTPLKFKRYAKLCNFHRLRQRWIAIALVGPQKRRISTRRKLYFTFLRLYYALRYLKYGLPTHQVGLTTPSQTC